MKITDHYQRFFAETGSEIVAAIFAVDAFHSEKKPNDQSDKLNPKDVAKQLSVSPATVIDWIRTRQLKASNIATGPRPRYTITKEALDAFLQMRQPEPPVRRSKRNRPA